MRHCPPSPSLATAYLHRRYPFLWELLISFFAVSLLYVAGSAADEPSAEIQFFENKIRPVLVEHCYDCHSAEAKKVQGGLLLDTRAGIRLGGDSGSAVVPEQVAESLLLDAIRYESFEMPPKGPLSEQVIADFEHWIRSGATDPRDGELNRTKEVPAVEAAREFWAFQPPRQTSAPKVRDTDWPHTKVDRYLLARLESEGLNPSADADRPSLLRRIYFALIGLPPTPEQLEAFIASALPLEEAVAAVVDDLLGSDHFGQRWGRHWLDVVRYADSSGGGRSALFPYAWRYRDYVIDAYNNDMSYDQFLQEQLAGDLLESADWQSQRRRIIATAFLVLGPTNFELQDKDILEMDIVDEQLDTLGKAMLGMTIGCARCHDHKFDPIPTRDYYAMAGIFKSTKFVIHDNVSTYYKAELPLSPEEEEKIAKLGKEAPPRPVAMAVAEGDKVNDIPLAIRGATHNRGPIVPRGVLQACNAVDFPGIADDESGRAELAQWITDPRHPLTARVYVNRVWYWLFGEGLVSTVDNFGATGDKPSHPELLDYLSLRFMEMGWSTKSLIREIMLSRVYHMSTEFDEQARIVDPENRLLSRMNRQRLDAESIRDAILFVAGQLDETAGGPSIAEGTKIEYGYVFESKRRSVYLPVFRNRLPELFESFDFADPNIQAGWRSTSTTTPQAHYLMNHPFVNQMATAAAQRLLDRTEQTGEQQIEMVFQQVLNRSPSAQETEMARSFLGRGGKNGNSIERWSILYQTLFQSIDFRFLN